MNRSRALQIVKRLGLRQLSVTTKTLPYTWQFRYISAVTGAPSPRPLDHKRQPHKSNRPTRITRRCSLSLAAPRRRFTLWQPLQCTPRSLPPTVA